MAKQTIKTTIIPRKDTYANWIASTAGILAAGEFGLDTTNNILKCGNGINKWVDLPKLNTATLGDLGIVATATEINYIDGVTSNIQTQLDNRALTTHTHSTYAKKSQGVYYVEGNTTGAAGTWTGSNSDITSYYDGLVVNYKIGIAGASTTTLNINGLGAKTCYMRDTSKLTTHYAVGTMVLLSYNSSTNAFYSADYDANSDVKTSSGNTSSKIFLIGATSQSTSGQTTYSHDTAYVGTDGCLYSNSTKVITTSELSLTDDDFATILANTQ